MEQQDIFALGQTIDCRFQGWLNAHPDAVAEFVKVARRLKREGLSRYSSDGIFHIMRWRALVKGHDVQGYRVNNDYSSRMARLVMQRFPDLQGFFQLRALKGE